MASALWGQDMTNMWMLDPTMFDPTQKSNQFSNYNDAPLPGPSYNTGAGGPTNAMGQAIPSFQAWQTANPAGMGINNTPAQPQVPQQAGAGGQFNYAAMGQYGPALQQLMGNYAAAQAKLTPQQLYNQQQTRAMDTSNAQNIANLNMNRTAGGGLAGGGNNVINSGPNYAAPMQQYGAPAPAPAPAPQTGGAPNNWMAALNALSQPGNPITQGANVPIASGYQPAGGVNQAFLGQVQTPGANQNFLSALAAIQGRPQSGQQPQRRTG